MEKLKDKFVLSILTSMKNSKAGFYLAFVGVIIQFIHNVLAFAGTFKLFESTQHWLLITGEWILVILLGFFFAGALFYFTIKSGSYKVLMSQSKGLRDENRKLKKRYDRNLKVFQVFDSLIDAYFWLYIVFLESDIDNVQNINNLIENKYVLLIVILPIVFMLPQTIRFYSGEVEN